MEEKDCYYAFIPIGYFSLQQSPTFYTSILQKEMAATSLGCIGRFPGFVLALTWHITVFTIMKGMGLHAVHLATAFVSA